MALSLIGSNGLNHPSIQRVIEIAEEIVSENKLLTAEILFKSAKKRLNLSRRGLISIIQLLFNRKILVEGSKFTKDSVLSNTYRSGIYNYIRSNLGTHFSKIRKEIFSGNEGTGSAGQLIWHLEMLIKFTLIKKIKVGNYTIFLPIDIDEDVGLIYFLINDPINKKILELLVEHESIQQPTVYKLINEKRELVYYRINNLIDFDIIFISEEDDNNNIRLNTNKKKVIIQILENKI